ncbi:MAG: AI-2E family transporter [Planctomycetota bacterium]
MSEPSRDADHSEALPKRDYNPYGKPETPLWRMRWFQVSLGVIVLLTVASYVVPAAFRLVYATRSVLTPILVGLTLAYIFNPAVTYLYNRFKVPRPVTAATMLATLGMIATGLLVLIPIMLWQALLLLQKIPNTIHDLAAREDLPALVEPMVRWLSETFKQLDVVAHSFFVPASRTRGEGTEAAAVGAGETAQASAASEAVESVEAVEAAEPEVVAEAAQDIAAAGEAGEAEGVAEAVEATGSFLDTLTGSMGDVNWRAVAEASSTVLDLGAGAVGSVTGAVGYALVFAVVAAFVFFFATWKFRDFVGWFDPYVPESHKQRTYEVLGMMDKSVSGFIRGRLIQASIMAVVLTIGLLFTDARPFALLLGVAGGALGVVPYVGLVVWPATIVVASLLNLQDGQNVSLLGAVILPSVVFVLAQSLDAYVVEPIVQGKATNLDALTVLLVVLIGGSLAGLLGLLIAIPAAACLKILWREVISPELKAFAKQA